MGAIKIKKYKDVQQDELKFKLAYYQKLLKENNIVEYDDEE